MPSKNYLMLRSAPFETPPAAVPQDKLAQLEGRKAVLQPFVSILAQPQERGPVGRCDERSERGFSCGSI